MSRLVGVLALALLVASGSFAQTSSLNGTVMDPSGAVLPNASLTLLNVETGAQRQTVSDSQGHYNIPQLPPGSYKLTATAPGFADLTVNKVELRVNEPATLALTFEKLGSTSTTVMVEAAATQINTVDASLGNAITS